MYTTLGAPSGAFGGVNGAQSSTESRMSTLTVPLNGSLIAAPTLLTRAEINRILDTTHEAARPIGTVFRGRWSPASVVQSSSGGGQVAQGVDLGHERRHQLLRVRDDAGVDLEAD